MLKKIVIIGPESTGKSTLCEQVAKHYETLWCPEYARAYLLKHGNKYNYDNLLTIAMGQIALESEYIEKVNSQWSMVNKNPPTNSPFTIHQSLLFTDTNMYVMKVWCEFVFGKCPPYIQDQIKERKYDLYLLCNTDLPWIKDELREYPDLKTRERLYHIYKDLMIGQEVPWIEINGNNEDRLLKAITTIDLFLKN